MRLRATTPSLLALFAAGALVLQGAGVQAFTLQGFLMPLDWRFFRVHQSFTGGANDNTTPDPDFPGHTGATLAIWKGVAEWGSQPHGSGGADPHQPGGIGSGGANFDSVFQGVNPSPGAGDGNTFSASPLAGGVLSLTELTPLGGWRVRFNSNFDWSDGPGPPTGSQIDLQGQVTYIYGTLLGLGPSNDPLATMSSSTTLSAFERRSIESDDIAGLQAIYGAASSTKPVVTGVTFNAGQVFVSGANFGATGNSLLFTPVNPTSFSIPVQVSGLPSNGTLIVAPLPLEAGPGALLVRRAGSALDDLSNSWPVTPTGALCPAPQVFCTSTPNSTGSTAGVSTTGTPSLTSNDLVVAATNAPANKSALFFYAPNPFTQPFGNGVLCLSGGLQRLPVLTTDASGAASQPIDLHAAPFGSPRIGAPLRFQLWFRDPAAGGAQFDTSDALLVRVCP